MRLFPKITILISLTFLGWHQITAQNADWLTTTERSGFRQTARYQETNDYFFRFAQASPWVKIIPFGKSPEGRTLFLVIIDRQQHFSPQATQAASKPIVLIENCIHPGECEGKDASMMLVRDLVIHRQFPDVLEKVILIIIPIFNVDGHERFSPFNRINQNGPAEMGWRVTATRLNLNRDFMKADTPEMRAWLKLFNDWQPHLFIDTHTTDGADFQYDILYNIDTHPEFGGAISQWAREVFLPEFIPACEAKGHLLCPYAGLIDRTDPAKGLRGGVWPPRLSNPYVTLRNRAGLLLETHSLKDYQTRVRASYDFILAALQIVARNPAALLNAVASEDTRCQSMGKLYDPGQHFALTFQTTLKADSLFYRGYQFEIREGLVSGQKYLVYRPEPADVHTVYYNHVTPLITVPIPLGYLIPQQWQGVIDVIRAHGIQIFRLTEAISDSFQCYRFQNPRWSDAPYEGRFRVSFEKKIGTEKFSLPAGTIYIPLAQQNARLILHLLEPDAPDALIRWGFFNTIFEQKEYFEHYTMEPLAQQMLAADPQLKDEFETKLAADSTFAKDSYQRLMFFYQRSPYWDQNQNRYPVLRVIRPVQQKVLPL